ncbi:MAG: TatD family hydrolase [Planctomycetes bacterium]|nr:TatD family hydrolase [Planctomycetota bacterium]
MIDTHAHLDFPEFKDDLPDVLNRANESGIEYIITVGTDLESSRKAIALAHRYAQIYAAIGIHPHNAHKVTEEEWEEFKTLVKDDKVVAIGETGLDMHKDYSPIEAQKELFVRHLNLAKESGKPFILHAREGFRSAVLSPIPMRMA